MVIVAGTGNLLDADVEALVNTVNTVGIMGKGVALQFKQAARTVDQKLKHLAGLRVSPLAGCPF